MLDKFEVPLIPDGYPLVVAMNALLDAVKSVSLITNNTQEEEESSPAKNRKTGSGGGELPAMPTSVTGDGVNGVMLKSSWSGVLAALALLLDAW